MTGAAILGVIAAFIIGGFLYLLAQASRVERPGPNTAADFARFLFWLAVFAGVFLTAVAIKEGWKP